MANIIGSIVNTTNKLYNVLASLGGYRHNSVLTKNYKYIWDNINRNIGEVSYSQQFGVNLGQVTKVEYETDKTLFNFLTDIRQSYVNYYDYGKSLNETISYSPLNFGDYTLTLSNDMLKTYGVNNYYDENDKGHLNVIANDYRQQVDLEMSTQNEKHISFNDYFMFYTNKKNYKLNNGYSYFEMFPMKVNGMNIGGFDITTSMDYSEDKLFDFNTKVYSNLQGKKFNSSLLNIDSLLYQIGSWVDRETSYAHLFYTVSNVTDTNNNVVRLDDLSENFTQDISYDYRITYAESNQENVYQKDNVTDSTSTETKGFLNNRTSFIYEQCNDLIAKTNKQFKHGKYKTMIARFGSNANAGENIVHPHQISEYETIHTAISSYGTSHGRNLLRHKDNRNTKDTHYKGGDKYNDPYCRVWTNYHTYNKYSNLIRPFATSDTDWLDYDEFESFNNLVKTKDRKDGFKNGAARLKDYGVLNTETNTPHISPTIGIDYDANGNRMNENKLKSCMFSIENLAWKGFTSPEQSLLSDEQRGPLGGRIMWFPPYDIKFSENVAASWNATDFIGRGEKIYTYANTDRSGQLHFKLLIDHPSIINYFADDTDPSRRDETPNDLQQIGAEYDLLRFFAGCASDIPLKSKNKVELQKPKPKIETIVERENRAIEKEISKEVDEELIFMVFYPNNYTGFYEKDDFDPFTYLINGVGAQKQLTENNQRIDIPTNDSVVAYVDNETIVGYEIRQENFGITPKGITDKLDDIISAYTYGNLTLCPQRNSRTSPKFDWWYRVDVRPGAKYDKATYGDSKNKCVDCEILSNVRGHKDLQSCGLNSQFGHKLVTETYAKDFKINPSDTEIVFAFTELYCVLYEMFKNGSSNPLIEELEGNFCDANRLALLREKLKSKLYTAEIQGFASDHGHKKSNITLANDRAKSIKNWLTKTMGLTFEKEPSVSGVQVQFNTSSSNGGEKNESEELAKRGRCAKIVIKLKGTRTEKVTEVQVYERTKTLENGEVISVGDYTLTDDSAIKNSDSNILDSEDAFKAVEGTLVKYSENGNKYEWFEGEGWIGSIDNTDVYADNMITKENVQPEDVIPSNINERYDNEYEFFQKLNLSDTVIKKRIMDKIKYFDPAFHSMSPEGFNARLTFLHQCTRQGPTIGNSDYSDSKTANNLAYGRQPVCVLRIGDFYNTKIIIESLSISYDPLVWDLNIEGVGVQPMIADVDISFKFLGGSDLAGPIGRLQNALSFNYYANTSVYDDRAEMIEYDENGRPTKYHANKKM